MLNTYVRNGEVRRTGGLVMLLGEAKFDPRIREMSFATMDGFAVPNWIPSSEVGRPGELVFHIAGSSYYPTRYGYVQLHDANKQHPQQKPVTD